MNFGCRFGTIETRLGRPTIGQFGEACRVRGVCSEEITVISGEEPSYVLYGKYATHHRFMESHHAATRSIKLSIYTAVNIFFVR